MYEEREKSFIKINIATFTVFDFVLHFHPDKTKAMEPGECRGLFLTVERSR